MDLIYKGHDLTPSLEVLCGVTTVAYRGDGVWGGFKLPQLRNSEGPPKSCQTQPNCEKC